MKVKDIILTASSYLGVEEKVRDFIEHRVPSCKEGELLLRCYNLIEKEVAQDYIPLIIEETFQTETGAVYYNQFSEQAVRVIKTQDSYGNDIACTLFPEYLKTQAGTIVIRYAYKPTDKTVDDDCAFDLRVSQSLLVYGVLTEYCLANGLFEESAVWDKKYKDAVAAAYRAKPAKRISARRWI